MTGLLGWGVGVFKLWNGLDSGPEGWRFLPEVEASLRGSQHAMAGTRWIIRGGHDEGIHWHPLG